MLIGILFEHHVSRSSSAEMCTLAPLRLYVQQSVLPLLLYPQFQK